MFRNKKKNFTIIIYIFLLISLISLIFYKTPGLKGGIEQEIRILTNNPIIINEGRYPIRSIPNIKIALKELINFKKKNYKNIKININYKNFDKLRTDRSKSIKLGMLENPIKVPVELIWEGKRIFAEGRLKGDMNDHRNFNKQWSLKLNLKNSDHIDGMTEFSITNHRSRNFPYNFLISKNLRRMGLHVPKFKTVKVNFNGYNWGVMLIEEHFTKEYLENRKLKNSLIFKLSNEKIMKIEHLLYYKKIISHNEFRTLARWQDKFNISYHNQRKLFKKKITYEQQDFIKKISLMKTLNEQFNIDDINTSQELVEKYIDLKSFATMLASTLAWGEGGLHSMALNNARFYINPYTLKITPIPADYEAIFHINIATSNDVTYRKKISSSLSNLADFYHPILINKKFQNLYLDSLGDFEKNLTNIYNDEKIICSNYNQICNNILKLDKLKKNIYHLKRLKKKIFESFEEFYTFKILKDNQNYGKYLQKKDLNKINYFNLYEEHINARLFDDGNLNIINLTNNEIYIDSIEIEKFNLKKKLDLKIHPSNYERAEIKKLNINLKPEANSIVKINYSYKKNDPLIEYKTFVEKKISLLGYKKKHYDFNKNEILINDKNIIFKGKKYIIDKPIIIPENYNLIILDGANLKFTKNSGILINKGSIKIMGKKNNNVNISAFNNKWIGIHVIGSNNASELNYTNFSKLNYFQNDKFNLSGAINFYNSNVKITNCKFEKSYSEDTINFIKSNFVVDNSIFSNSKSDAIDSDFSNGVIKNSKFFNIDGDAIDTSGSNVEINQVEISNVGDKGISAGEDSMINIKNVLINSAKIGIASKDSSKVSGSDIIIKNSKLLDLASYNKKKIYNGGEIKLTKIISDNKYLNQINSIMEINNKKLIEQNFKTKELY